MPVLIVGREKDFAALRSRLFAGRVPKKAVAEVADAIREANPHADLDDLKPGTILSVPDAPYVAVGSDLSADLGGALDALSKAGMETLQSLVDRAKAQEAQTRASRRVIAKSLDQGAVTSAAQEDETLAADLEAVRQAIADEDGRDKERASVLKKAQSEWTAGLDALKEVLA